MEVGPKRQRMEGTRQEGCKQFRMELNLKEIKSGEIPHTSSIIAFLVQTWGSCTCAMVNDLETGKSITGETKDKTTSLTRSLLLQYREKNI